MMARPLPLNAQPCQSQTHTLARDPQALLLLQVMPQERRGPHRRPIPQRAWVLVNEAINQRINNLIGGPWSATARAISKPTGDSERLALVEACPQLKIVRRLTPSRSATSRALSPLSRHS